MWKASSAWVWELSAYYRGEKDKSLLWNATLRFPIGKIMQSNIAIPADISQWLPPLEVWDLIHITHSPFFQEIVIQWKKQRYVRVNFMILPKKVAFDIVPIF